MPTEITLEGIRGPLCGEKYVFSGRTTCILGRSPDCNPRVPDVGKNHSISRHHCLLDINPPDIRVRDLGSLNGTYVNGREIGRRNAEARLSRAATTRFLECDLAHGDRLQIGDSVFRICLKLPLICHACSEEIATSETPADSPSPLVCRRCRDLGQTLSRVADAPKQSVCCASCAAPVSHDSTRNRAGEVLCEKCRTEPDVILLCAQSGSGKNHIGSIGDYEVIRKIGTGGMGAVYDASHKQTGHRAALKILLPQIAASREAVGRFLREINITKVLNHKNIVTLLDSGYSNGAFFLCLEYCNGGSVHDLMEKSGGTLSIDIAFAITIQVLDALAYAHSIRISGLGIGDAANSAGNGLIHRDIKPKNILLSSSGSVDSIKICDFGLSKAFDLSGLSGLTCTGDVGGSPYFMCRQQVINFKYAKHEVDVWSAAATLYNMLTGEFPRDFSVSGDPWQIVLDTEPIPIRERRRSIPLRLAEVIDEALRDRQSVVFRTATQFREALAAAL